MTHMRDIVKWLDIPVEHRADRVCASADCVRQATCYYEAGDVGSDYCTECANKIRAHIERWDALPPETLPCMPGDVIIICPSCQTQWTPEDERCPKCGRGMDEPVQ